MWELRVRPSLWNRGKTLWRWEWGQQTTQAAPEAAEGAGAPAPGLCRGRALAGSSRSQKGAEELCYTPPEAPPRRPRHGRGVGLALSATRSATAAAE